MSKGSQIQGIGAGWKKESKEGTVYIRLNLDVNKLAEFMPEDANENGVWCNLFRVKKKKSEKSPDYNLVIFVDSKEGEEKDEKEDKNEPF